MIYPIDWHEDWLKNSRATYEWAKQRAIEAMNKVEKMKQQLLIYEQQIERAKKEGKTSFDRERFGVARKKQEDTR